MNTFLLLTWVAVIAASYIIAVRLLKKMQLF